MDYNSNIPERYRKSVLVSLNTDEQGIEEDNEMPLRLGNVIYQSGTALKFCNTYHEIINKGLYRVDATVGFAALDYGTVHVQILCNGKPLDEAKAKLSVSPGLYYTIPLCAPALSKSDYAACQQLELAVAGPALHVVNTMLSTTKLA